MAETWWTYPAEDDNGNTILVSGRDGMQKYIESRKYSDRIEIKWTFEGSMPDEPTSLLMEQAHEAIVEALKKEKAVLLTGVYTGAGERNWVFYVKNPRIFQSVLNRAWASLPLLPVTISAEKDPEWLEYKEMRELTYIPPQED